jgi:hypothetical protein
MWWVGPRESNSLHESLVEGTQRAVLMCFCILLCYVGFELGSVYIVNPVTDELLHDLSYCGHPMLQSTANCAVPSSIPSVRYSCQQFPRTSIFHRASIVTACMYRHRLEGSETPKAIAPTISAIHTHDKLPSSPTDLAGKLNWIYFHQGRGNLPPYPKWALSF